MDKILPRVHDHTQTAQKRLLQTRRTGQLASFSSEYYSLVSRDSFHESEQLCFCWHGPRIVIKALNDYLYSVENLCSGKYDAMRASGLKFYREPDLDQTALMSHVLFFETGMLVAHLLRLVKQDDGLFVVVCWK